MHDIYKALRKLFVKLPDIKCHIDVDNIELECNCLDFCDFNCNKFNNIISELSYCALNSKFVKSLSLFLRPWLLEILIYCKNNVVYDKSASRRVDIHAHTAFVVSLSEILNCDIDKFILNYFEDGPSPIQILDQDYYPAGKKLKRQHEIPFTNEEQIFSATYKLLQKFGNEIAKNMEFSSLFKYLGHGNDTIKWYICGCISMVFGMQEYEYRKLILTYVSLEFHSDMLISLNLDNKESHQNACSYTSNDLEMAKWSHTCKIGHVVLPLFSKNIFGGTLLEQLKSTKQNLESIALGISSNRPVLIEGFVGSGKSSLVEHLAQITGRNCAPFLTKIQLSDHTDSKTLIGNYRCTANPGEFVWQAGSLTQAVIGGHWLLLEDIDFAPLDVISLLIPLLESRILPVPGRGNVRSHANFQVFATRRILPAGLKSRVNSCNLLDRLWTKVSLVSLSVDELKELICSKWPELSEICDKLIEVYLVLSYGQHGDSTFEGCEQCQSRNSVKSYGRLVSVRDLMKWCSRMSVHIDKQNLNVRAFQEALDCFCSAVQSAEERYSFALHIGSHLNINKPLVDHYVLNYRAEISVNDSKISVGQRGEVLKQKTRFVSLRNVSKCVFSKTKLSSCLLEKVIVSVMNKEPVLIVGETGIGKTATVQYLAEQTNHSLMVINMNQQSDSSDLLGGYKPVEVKTIVAPVREQFETVFSDTFSASQNTPFLHHVMTCFADHRWGDLFKLMKYTISKARERLKSVKKSKKSAGQNTSFSPIETKELLSRWKELHSMINSVEDQVNRVKNSLAFQFIEGSLVKAVQKGEWVLLDEINLASADTLECLSGLLESSVGSLTLHERGDSKPITRHPEFMLFACMNPATDVGKKELPAGFRNRFTEVFMDEYETEDLKQIVRDYLQEFNPSIKQIHGIVKFYNKVKKNSNTLLMDGTGHKPHFSLRTLCRALIVVKRSNFANMKKTLYEAFRLSFLTQLDRSSYKIVTKWIQEDVVGSKVPKISQNCPGKAVDYVQIEDFWLPKGDLDPQEPSDYILTESVLENLKDLARIVAIGKFPVLLQGDTSVGKTSLITYLAKRTGTNCFRINNHQHTDLQEYLGSYAPDHTGKLVFKEGILIQAMRKGYWVILDELNLAPSDVLEALNRLLDDNRELYVAEIETMVKAHSKFMLFATQNPSGLYGGRQALSRAFRNRFVELHFDIIPSKELELILHKRCQVSASLAKRMVNVLNELQTRRRESNLFQGKQSFITLRDLFRWAERYRQAPTVQGFYDWDQHVCDEGFLVLAGKIRIEREVEAIKEVLKKYLKREVKTDALFTLSDSTSPVTRSILENLKSIEGFDHVVWTEDMRRLFVLVSKALIFYEPILLVGETGCGKTTVCQMISAIKKQRLYTVNCHMHTEGADFLGGLRPVRERNSKDDDRLFEWVDGPLIQAMKTGALFLADEISLADDSVLERLNSVLEPERTLTLPEKGSSDFDEDNKENYEYLEFIKANDNFRLVGTMNPGGDYGKKELSPALRNRMTEIWCPKLEIERSTSDISLIINHNLSKILSAELRNEVANAIVSFLKSFASTDLGKKATISIRDILSWVNFYNQVTDNNVYSIPPASAFVHGACLVLLDSLGSGNSGNAVQSWKRLKENSLKYLCIQAQKLSNEIISVEQFTDVNSSFIDTKTSFGISPFVITKGNSKTRKVPNFSFEAPKTCLNLVRILRGLQLSHPILLEGSPGVGKTSLVIALAKASSNDIVRINLSEQTDVSDLFGADLPVEGSEGGNFAWRDGPLLQALKNGAWIVLDELNLASQSVLEGLNACFDHRGEIYVPELNKTFKIEHKMTKIFACQNPQFQGGARKGLPKSFLNRFTQVFVEPLGSDDLKFILGVTHPNVNEEIISTMVHFNSYLVEKIQVDREFGGRGGPWELNLRDMFRWCEIMTKNQPLNALNPGKYVELIYADRMRSPQDKISILESYKTIFDQKKFPLNKKSGAFFMDESSVQFGSAVIQRNLSAKWPVEISSQSDLMLMHAQTPFLESLVHCINMNWMILLVGGSSVGKSSLVQNLSNLVGEKLETISINSHMDVTELLGGFEQADCGRNLSEIKAEVKSIVYQVIRYEILYEKSFECANHCLSLWKKIVVESQPKSGQTTSEEVNNFVTATHSTIELIQFLRQVFAKKKKFSGEIKRLNDLKKSCVRLIRMTSSRNAVSGGGTFEWVDSTLVSAVRDGRWLLIEGVNLCSASVLDRLNALLEPGGVLTMSERGVIDGQVPTIKPHPNFKLFLVMDPLYGEISRAMRNRGIEICIVEPWKHLMDKRSVLLSHGISDLNHQNILTLVHDRIRHDLPAYQRPSISSMIQCAAMTSKLVQLGQSVDEALRFSFNLIYVRNMKNVKANVSNIIEVTLKECEPIMANESSAIATNLSVNSKHILANSSLSYVLQIVSFMRLVLLDGTNKNNRFSRRKSKKLFKKNMKVKGKLGFSKKGKKSLISTNIGFITGKNEVFISDKIAVAVFVVLCSLSHKEKAYFINVASKLDLGKKFLSKVKKVLEFSCLCIKKLESMFKGSLPLDPRYNMERITFKVDEINHLANKALLSFWINVSKNFKAKSTKKDLSNLALSHSLKSNKKEGLSVLALSKSIKEGKNEKMIFHQSLKYIYVLLRDINLLFLNLSNNVNIPFGNEEFYEVSTGLRWKSKFETVCQKIVSRSSFHLLLPELAYHWKKLHEHLIDKIPSSWMPKSMPKIVKKMQTSFETHCSLIHNVVPDLRNSLGYPTPFIRNASHEKYLILQDMSENLNICLKSENIKKLLFLSSDIGHAFKFSVINLICNEVNVTDEELHKSVKETKKNLTENILSIQATDNQSFNVQLFPIIDFFVSKKLSLISESDTVYEDLKTVFSTASKIPFLYAYYLNKNNSSTTIFSYIFNIKNSSSSCPSKWYFYDGAQKVKENRRQEILWEEECKTVIYPMGSVLTYHTLLGFCNFDIDSGFMSIGNYAERGEQLGKIQATLQSNFHTLNTSEKTFSACFQRKVFTFVRQFLKSFGSVLKYESEYDITDFNESVLYSEKLLLRSKHLLGVQGENIFVRLIESKKSLQKLQETPKDFQKIVEVGKLGVVSGLFQTWVLAHMEILDPAKEISLLLLYCKQDLKEYKDFVTVHNWMRFLRFNNSVNTEHPYYFYYQDQIEKLKKDKIKLSKKTAYRPHPPQYLELVEDVKHFMTTIFEPRRILDLLDRLTISESDCTAMCEGVLRSCDNFIDKVLTNYSLYRDLTFPLLHGIVISCESFRCLIVLIKNRLISNLISHNASLDKISSLDDALINLLSFPAVRRMPDFGENYFDHSLKQQKILEKLLSETSENESSKMICQSLTLKASSYELYNYAVTAGNINKESFIFLKWMINEVILWWQEQEEEKKRRAQEEESLYKYKAKSLAISETEEEEMEREFKELFPDYESEFKDIEDEDYGDDGDSVENMEIENEMKTTKITQEDFVEIIEIHRLLTNNFTYVLWRNLNDGRFSKMIEANVALKAQQVRLLLKAIGPFATHKVDEAAIGSFIVCNKILSSDEYSGLNLVQKPHNYYQDPVPEEARKVKPLLEVLSKKCDELLGKWPDHPSLVMIKKVIKRVLEYPISSPLIRLVIGLETVLEKSQEWEKNAHKGVSLMKQITPITEQVIEWRKLELKSWKKCLDMVTYKIESEAEKFWPHMYISLLSVGSGDMKELIASLKQFMEGALVGDFKKRLNMINTFHFHLCLEQKFQSNIAEHNKNLQTLISITWNFYKYFLQFEKQVEENVKTMRLPIEKDVKNYVKIAKWNDINFFSVRDSVIKSRRTLHRHMKNWEKLLKEPVSSLLIDTPSDLTVSGDWDKDKAINLQAQYFDVILPSENNIYADEGSLLSRIVGLSKISSRLVKEITDNVPYKECVQALEDLTDEIITTYQDLSVATSKAENLTEKDDRLRSLKDIVNRKKSSFSYLCKALHHRGVSYTRGNNLWTDESLDSCLTVPPLGYENLTKSLKLDERINEVWESCEKYYYKSVGRFSLLINSLNKAHKDLGPEDVKRLKGFSNHLMILLCEVRKILPDFSHKLHEIFCIKTELSEAIKGYRPNFEIDSFWEDIGKFAVNLSLLVDEEITLLESYNINDPILVLEPQSNFLETDRLNIIGYLKEIKFTMKPILKRCSYVDNAHTFLMSSETNMEELEDIISKISEFSEKLRSIVSIINKKSKRNNSITKPCLIWLNEWDNLCEKIEEHKYKYLELDPDGCDYLEDIEPCIKVMLKAVENLYKSHCSVKSETKDVEEETKGLISKQVVESFISDFKDLKINEVSCSLKNIVANISNNPANYTWLETLKLIVPLIEQYLNLCQTVLLNVVNGSSSLNKLESVLLGIFMQMSSKGFCKAQELEEQEGRGEGQMSFEDSGPGLSEGDGKKDVSERFESEDQLESALQKGEKEESGSNDLKEDDGIEMSNDFEGKMQDLNKEDENDEKSGDESEEEPDKQMGETEKGADKLDEKIWGDDEEEKEDDSSENKNEEDGPGDGEVTEPEMVAKDDNKNKEENKKEKKKLDVMEEDRREPEEEPDEETYGDDYTDKFGGENDNEEPEDTPLEISDDLNLDDKEADEESEKDAEDICPEIEQKDLFPEEDREPKDKGEENEEDKIEEQNPDKKDENEQSDSNKDNHKTGEEVQEEEEMNEGERAQPTEEPSVSADAEASQMDSINAADNTKNQLETATNVEMVDDENEQEEQGEMGEQTDDVTGAGQSDSKTKDESHKGEDSALKNEQANQEQMKNVSRKHMNDNQNKSIGDVKKEIQKGLLTKKESGKKEENSEPEDEGKENEDKEEEEAEGRDAELYEHINKADGHYDKQTIDAATLDEAKLQPAPQEEKQKEEELEGLKESVMDVTEEKENDKNEDNRKREAETDGTEGPRVKKIRQENDDKNKTPFEIEGEKIQEMLVQRPIVNTIETKIENQDDVLAAIFSEDIVGAREKIKEADEGDANYGIKHWSDLEGRITPLALQLCEQLRLILEPTEASKLKGDYRTGKRLNMRKIIAYIASQFRKDKIWLRRSQPNKRSYQVLLAVDDSESMNEMNAGALARESVALVAKAMTLLEVGQTSVVSFGTETKILHPFHIPFTDMAGSKVFANLKFNQTKSDFAQMLEDATALLAGAKTYSNATSEVAQLLLIMSDGQTHARSKAVKAAVRAAREAGVFIVFFVLDAQENSYSFYDHMIYEDGELKLMVDSFPFPFFIVVRDIDSLPDGVATALRQWFELVTSDSR